MKRVLVAGTIVTAVAALLMIAGTAFAHDPELNENQMRYRSWSRQDEAVFLERMMNRHALAAQVGKLARQRASHAKLRAWGDSLSRVHTVETKRIQTMLRSNYQVTPAPPAVVTGSLMKAKGAAFDQELLYFVVRELGEGLGEAKDCQRMGMGVDLRSACASWAALQQREVVEAGSWLCEWFQKCE